MVMSSPSRRLVIALNPQFVNPHFVRYDIGAGQPRRDERGDCTVRALATASGMPYEEAWELLYKLQGINRHCAFRIFEYLRKMPQTMGVVGAYKYRALKGQPRIKVRDFVVMHPQGRFLLQVAHHVTAVVDGKLIDTWDCGRKCVYGAWEIKRR